MPFFEKTRTKRREQRAQEEIALESLRVRYPRLGAHRQWLWFAIMVLFDFVLILAMYIWWTNIKDDTGAWPTIAISLATGFVATATFGFTDALISRRAHDKYAEDVGDCTLTALQEFTRNIHTSLDTFERVLYEQIEGDLAELKLLAEPTKGARQLGLSQVFQNGDTGSREALDRLIRRTPDLVLFMNLDNRWVTEHIPAFQQRFRDLQQQTMILLPDLRDEHVLEMLAFRTQASKEELKRRQLQIFDALEGAWEGTVRPFSARGHNHLHAYRAALGKSQALVEPYFTSADQRLSRPCFWYRGENNNNYVKHLHNDAVAIKNTSRDLIPWFEDLTSARTSHQTSPHAP
ncbi:hypothetical protein [Streptomyces sp. NPDC059874]|uniref:hypothetical protein n=1 Tax=Streptomyces sp. NPDC059874 TaxID=3346983 RepID=UPI00364C9A2C